jgi:hypothetical protein
MRKMSIVRVAIPVKSLEIIDGSKFLGRILVTGGRAYHLIKGDRIIVVRRKRVIYPK